MNLIISKMNLLKNLRSQICSYEKNSFNSSFEARNDKINVIQRCVYNNWFTKKIRILYLQIKNLHMNGQKLSKTVTKLPWPGFTCILDTPIHFILQYTSEYCKDLRCDVDRPQDCKKNFINNLSLGLLTYRNRELCSNVM